MSNAFKDIVTDKHMYDIAMAIREILGPDSGMTILDMPNKILEIKRTVTDVVNELVDALCWTGDCPDILHPDIMEALRWVGVD